jgi:hypothetical protein
MIYCIVHVTTFKKFKAWLWARLAEFQGWAQVVKVDLREEVGCKNENWIELVQSED